MENNYQPLPLTPYQLKPLKKTHSKSKKILPIPPIISQTSLCLSSSNENNPPTPVQAGQNPFMNYARRFGTELGNAVIKGSVTLVVGVSLFFALHFLNQIKQFKPFIGVLKKANVIKFDEKNSEEKEEKEGVVVSYEDSTKYKELEK